MSCVQSEVRDKTDKYIQSNIGIILNNLESNPTLDYNTRIVTKFRIILHNFFPWRFNYNGRKLIETYE